MKYVSITDSTEDNVDNSIQAGKGVVEVEMNLKQAISLGRKTLLRNDEISYYSAREISSEIERSLAEKRQGVRESIYEQN